VDGSYCIEKFVKDHYSVLGVTREADPDVVRAAYYALVKKFHPDKTGNDPRLAALERAKTLEPIFKELKGKSAREIARTLNERKIATPTGAPWSPVTVNRARQRLA
jgi:curved DNA-binding protein CbpA